MTDYRYRVRIDYQNREYFGYLVSDQIIPLNATEKNPFRAVVKTIIELDPEHRYIGESLARSDNWQYTVINDDRQNSGSNEDTSN